MSFLRHSAISAVNDPAQSSFSSSKVIVDEDSVIPYSICPVFEERHHFISCS